MGRLPRRDPLLPAIQGFLETQRRYVKELPPSVQLRVQDALKRIQQEAKVLDDIRTNAEDVENPWWFLPEERASFPYGACSKCGHALYANATCTNDKCELSLVGK